MKRKKVLLVGNMTAYYRSELWASLVIEEKYEVAFATRRYYGTVGYIRKLFALIFFNLEILFKSPFANLVVLLPMNHNSIFILVLLRKIFKYKLVADLYISSFDTSLDRRKHVKFGAYKKKMDRLIIEKVDVLIHHSKNELDYIANKVGATINEGIFQMVPLCVPDRFNLINQTSTKNEFKVCWWGTYVPLQGLEQVLDSIRIIKETNTNQNIRFYLFGIDLNEKEMVYSFIKKYSLGEMVIFRIDATFSNGKLIELLKGCNLALGVFGKSEKAKNIIANKILDAASMGIPILTMDSKITKEYFGERVFYSSNDPADMASSLIDLSRTSLEGVGERLYLHYKANYSFDEVKSSIKKILVSLT